MTTNMLLTAILQVFALLASAGCALSLRSSREPNRYISYVAKIGGMPRDDVDRLLDGVRRAAGTDGETFLLTVTTGGMVDLAQNMLRSLDAAPADCPRLVIGMGSGVCEKFENFWKTICVDVFRDSFTDEVAWGSQHYYQVVLRKHVVLSIVSFSGMSKAMVFSDPDIVYMASPVDKFRKFAAGHDIVFSPNNYLEPDASGIEDLSADYERRGMANITIGSKGRHVDINTGLFYMRNSSKVNHLWLEALRIFINQEKVHGHYQQYSLVTAMDLVPSVSISVAPGDVFVNGNVFWGHRDLLDEDRVVSVHANWMQSNLKRTCLDAAGLWIDPEMVAGRLRFSTANDMVEMDEKAATVTRCARRDL